MAFGNIGQIPPNYLASSVLTSQEIAFIQNLNSRSAGNANNVVLMNSNNGGLPGQYLRVNSDGTGLEWASGGGGATTFLDLTDTPSSYATHGLKLVQVNSSENALQFTPIASLLTAGSGISITGTTNVTITNTGVLSLNTATGAITLQGTTNQINVSTTDSTITLSTPQDIHTGATPQFAELTLYKATSGIVFRVRDTSNTYNLLFIENDGKLYTTGGVVTDNFYTFSGVLTIYGNLFVGGSGTFNTSTLTIGNLVLSASGLTASRIFTFPDASTTLVGVDTPQSLSNKRIYPRQSIQTSPSSITPDKSQYDEYYVTALANDITIYNATSPSVGDTFVIYITDNGTARSISWGSHYVGIGSSLPTSTTANKTMEIIIKYVGSSKALVSYTNQESSIMAWLIGWQYRRPITINNSSNSNSLTDYQVLVTLDTQSLISAGKMKTDCGDIRFTDSDGSTLLNYWIESGCNTASTKIWVKVPSIPANSSKTIYVYYGNPSATSLSNGDATFDFFDDFLGTSVDTSKWIITDTTGWSIVSGELKGTNTTGRLTSIPTFNPGIILEIKSRYISLPPNGYQIGGFFISTSDGFGFLNHPSTDYYRNDATWVQLGPTSPSATNLLTKITVKSSTQVDLSVTNYNTGASYQSVSNIANTVSNEPIALGRRYDGYYTAQSYEAYWDWIRVRKYTSPEPTTSVGAEETLLTSARRRLLLSTY
jgi:hypothetical protein